MYKVMNMIFFFLQHQIIHMSLVIIAYSILFLHNAWWRFLDKKKDTTILLQRSLEDTRNVVNSLGKDIRGFWPETSALEYWFSINALTNTHIHIPGETRRESSCVYIYIPSDPFHISHSRNTNFLKIFL